MNRSKRHTSFVSALDEQSCEIIHEVSKPFKCAFIMRTEDCHKHDNFIDYTHFVFCSTTLDHGYVLFSHILVMIIICVYLFLVLGVAADKFFCPALTAIAKKLGLSESIAGATILAFGNASPDLFTALVDYSGDTKMLYAQTFGGQLFLIGFVAAIIFIVSPVSLGRAYVLRDMFFNLVTCLWLATAYNDEHFTYCEAIGAIIIYVIYLLTVIVPHFLEESALKVNNSKVTITHNNAYSDIVPGPNANLFKQFLHDVNPIDMEEWGSSTATGKSVQILKLPILLLLNISIPVVDNSLEMNGWSKLLNTLQIIILPLVIVFVSDVALVELFNIALVWYLLGISFILAVLIFLTTRTDQHPRYHILFALFGTFLGSICIISACAAEVVGILSAFGVIANVSDSLIGLSVLTWGNNIGDLIANVSLARSGFPKMAFAACIGSAIFSGLLGTGMLFMIKLVHTESGKVLSRHGDTGPISSFFLFLLLVFTFVAFTINGFQGRRSLGIFMMLIYLTYLLFCVLSELEIMHPYGTSHGRGSPLDE